MKRQAEEKGLLDALEKHPGDQASMLAYSDWLSDQGRDDEAFAWLWAARRGRWPYKQDSLYSWGLDPKESSGVPKVLYEALGRGLLCRWRIGLQASFALLGEALAVLREAVRIPGEAA